MGDGTAVFTENPDGTYDLTLKGRAIEYDLDVHEFPAAIRRSRKDFDAFVIEDITGYRQPLQLG